MPVSHVLEPTDARLLRSVFGRFTTGVAVVTARTPDGMPTGMTVNSFSSISLEPPLVLFCVNRASRLHPVFADAGSFAVNVLQDNQKELSRAFARPGLARFGDVRPATGPAGTPAVRDALAVIECATERLVPAGDHDIVIGRVIGVSVDADPGARPLVYFGGAYRALADDDADWWTAFS